MAKVTFTSLKLKTDTSTIKVQFNNTDIEVLKYLPVEDKYSLISIALQKSKEGRLYNPIKLDTYFHLYLIYSYTNISFTDKQREDEFKLYDILKSNHLIDLVLSNMEETEYDELIGFMNEQIENEFKYGISAASIISSLIDDLPKNAEAVGDIINSFDKDKYSEVINFAKALNGGRPI